MRLFRHGCEVEQMRQLEECEARRAISVRFRYLILWRRRDAVGGFSCGESVGQSAETRTADLVGKKRGYVFALIMIVDIELRKGALLRDEWTNKDGTERGCDVLRFMLSSGS